MGIFTSKLELAPLEKPIIGSIEELLLDKTTEIHCDQKGNRYLLKNEKHHFIVTILVASNMIRMTNSVFSAGEKYREKLVNHAIDLIINEKHSRIEAEIDVVETTMQKLSSKMHDQLKNSNRNVNDFDEHAEYVKNVQIVT